MAKFVRSDLCHIGRVFVESATAPPIVNDQVSFDNLVESCTINNFCGSIAKKAADGQDARAVGRRTNLAVGVTERNRVHPVILEP